MVVLDTETTGISPLDGHRIIELSCVELVNGKIGEKRSWQIFPERQIPKAATEVHGISDADVAHCPLFSEIVHEFIDFIGTDTLIIHNAEFDMGFVNTELVEHCHMQPLPIERAIDTLALARERFPASLHGLYPLCRRFNIDVSKKTSKGALLDAECLAGVYLELITILPAPIVEDNSDLRTIERIIKSGGFKNLTSSQLELISELHTTRLTLESVSFLTKNEAVALAKWPGRILELKDLTALTQDIAHYFSEWNGMYLNLNGLKHLSAEVANELLSIGILGLDGLKSISIETAKALSNFKGSSVSLNGLENFEREIFLALNENQSFLLGCDGIKILSNDDLEELVYIENIELSFGGISCPSRRCTKVLVKHAERHGVLEMNGITNLTEDIADIISNFNGDFLDLNGLKDIQPAVARILSRWEGQCLAIAGIEKLSWKVARNITREDRLISLGGINRLSPETAYAITALKESVLHLGVEDLSEKSAEIVTIQLRQAA